MFRSRVGAVALVVVGVAVAAVVNYATDGRAWWLWPVLGVLVLTQSVLVWRQHGRSPHMVPATRVDNQATAGGVGERIQTDVPATGDVLVRNKATWWGKLRDIRTTVRK